MSCFTCYKMHFSTLKCAFCNNKICKKSIFEKKLENKTINSIGNALKTHFNIIRYRFNERFCFICNIDLNFANMVALNKCQQKLCKLYLLERFYRMYLINVNRFVITSEMMCLDFKNLLMESIKQLMIYDLDILDELVIDYITEIVFMASNPKLFLYLVLKHNNQYKLPHEFHSCFSRKCELKIKVKRINVDTDRATIINENNDYVHIYFHNLKQEYISTVLKQ